MPLALDANSSAIDTTAGTSFTLSHTCTGTDLILLVGVGLDTTSDDITGVTYNGVAMTRINSVAGGRFAALYYLINPDTGTHDVVASFSSSRQGFIHAISLTGVDQVSPITDSDTAGNGGAGASTTPSIDVASNGWGVAYAIGFDTGGTAGNFTIDGTTQSTQNTATLNMGSRLATKEPHQYTPPTLTFTATAFTDQSESLCAATIKPKGGFIPRVSFM